MADLSPYMRLAIDEAKISLREGNCGFGAVIIKDGQLTEKPTTDLLRQIPPGLRITRNDERLRPYTPDCEEMIILDE